MTELLEKAFVRAAQLPDAEQDALAAWILDELEDEQRWSHSFAKSQDILAKLADEALAEFEAELTDELHPASI